MTNVLDGLLGRIDDPALRQALRAEVDRLRSTKDFGLVFEKHMPENVRLYSHPVRRGLRVEERSGETDSTWMVRCVRDGKATLVDADGNESERSVEELVVVRQFGEPIYPGLKSVGRIERGGDKPFHTVINGENYHALETLLYAYEGKVDCIYIDPPYNTGAKDWKYNNDYVAADDAYRHSKWLNFMERRLELAKRLLNPDDSVLIVTIDEKEVNRVCLLLDQLFVGGRRQTITSVISPGGTSRVAEFSRVEEYVIFVFLGDAAVKRSADSMLGDSTPLLTVGGLWEGMVRRGNGVIRAQRPGQFYPVYVDEITSRIADVGEPLAAGADRKLVPERPNLVTVWPIKPGGIEGFWQLGPESLRSAAADGTAKASFNATSGEWTIKYMKDANARAVREGQIETIGYESNGDRILHIPDSFQKPVTPKTVWHRASHDPSVHGARLLTELLAGRHFPFPKSLYAVEDSLRFAVGDKRSALIVDFFGGSGTTSHAVVRLNRQDGGERRSIVVTNNEVSVEEAKELRQKGLSPGDPAWEAQGIFEHITKPRIEAAITGITHIGEPVKGEYKFADEFPMSEGFEENVEFLELTYLDRNDVSRGKSFEAIASLLWMRAGACGEMITRQLSTFHAPKGARYAVLFDIDVWPKFVEATRSRDDLEHVFIVTDSLAMYQQVVAELPAEIETTMLYEDYLRNFEINKGGMT